MTDDDFYTGGYPNRTACDCLRELRTCHKVRNYSGVLGLVEELQSMFNRMEAALYDKNDLEAAQKKVKELRKEIKQLSEEKGQGGG